MCKRVTKTQNSGENPTLIQFVQGGHPGDSMEKKAQCLGSGGAATPVRAKSALQPRLAPEAKH